MMKSIGGRVNGRWKKISVEIVGLIENSYGSRYLERDLTGLRI